MAEGLKTPTLTQVVGVGLFEDSVIEKVCSRSVRSKRLKRGYSESLLERGVFGKLLESCWKEVGKRLKKKRRKRVVVKVDLKLIHD